MRYGFRHYLWDIVSRRNDAVCFDDNVALSNAFLFWTLASSFALCVILAECRNKTLTSKLGFIWPKTKRRVVN